MQWLRSSLVVVLVLVAQWAVAETTINRMQHQGIERFYRLAGASAQAEARPLIVHLHGFREPDQIAGSQDLTVIRWRRLEALAAEAGFVVAAPSAWKGRWSMGLDLPNVTLPSGAVVDDVGFVRKLAQRLVQAGVADPAQIYLSGISDGGIMTQRILCKAGHPFRAGASLIGTMYEAHARRCSGGKPVPILVLAGTHDPVLPYDGWIFPTGRALSAPEIANMWRLRHGCTGQATKLLPNVAKRDYTRVRQIDWTGCARDPAVRLLRIEGGTHEIPSMQRPKGLKFGWTGKSRDIETADQIWQFFSEVAK